MGKKDIETVKYTSRNDVVADIINCAFCNGQHIVDEKDISELDGRENITIPYINDTNFKKIQKFRDVLKKVHLTGLDFVTNIVIGIEDQSNVNYAIPVKNNLYDAINYASQVEHIAKMHRKNKDVLGDEFLSGFKKIDKIIPIITIVVYFGVEDKWDGPLSLKEMMDLSNIPEVMTEAIPDYKVHLLQPSEISDKLLDSARSDFGRMMKLLKQQALNGEIEDAVDKQKPYLLSKEAAAIIKSFTGFEITGKSEKEGVIDMSDEVLRIEARGKAEQLIISVENVMKALQYTLEEACSVVGSTVEAYNEAKCLER